jgi:hypothetical protein
MAFIDDITVHATAGRGGDGVVRWLHLKGKIRADRLAATAVAAGTSSSKVFATSLRFRTINTRRSSVVRTAPMARIIIKREETERMSSSKCRLVRWSGT